MIEFTPTPENQVDEYVYQTPIEGLIFIKHKQFDDHRGFYSEVARIPEIEDQTGKSFTVKQLNFSHSKQNVARGFHAENWRKLLTVINGTVFGVWADFQTDSPTFKQTVSITLGPDALFGSVFVEAGIGNSFLVTSGPADYLYAVDHLYSKRDKSGDVAVSLFDQDLDVPWPIDRSEMILSDRDKKAITMREQFPQEFK
jgi:dTDP-4-dehydrorhamnose 3,5-epimerase